MKTNVGETLTLFDVGSGPQREQFNSLAQRMSVSVILTVCSDVHCVARIAQRIRAVQALQALVEIVVVDTSTVATHEAREQWMDLVDVYKLRPRQNKLAAIGEGVASAMGEVVLIWDVTSDCDPADFRQVTDAIVQGKADVVIGRPLMQAVDMQSQAGPSRSQICSAMRVDVLDDVALEEFWGTRPMSQVGRKWRVAEVFIRPNELRRRVGQEGPDCFVPHVWR